MIDREVKAVGGGEADFGNNLKFDSMWFTNIVVS